MKRAQLIITYGLSDLQVLVDTPGGLRRAFLKSGNAPFYRWLGKQQPDPVMQQLGEIQNMPEISVTWDDATETLSESRDGQVSPRRDDAGAILLAAPKLEKAILNDLRAEFTITRALFLSTGRDCSNEPSDAVHFLSDYLTTHHHVPRENIVNVIYLPGNERLEGEDSPIAWPVAERLEQALRDFIRPKEGTVLVTAVGGLPEVKNYIRQLVPLFARHSQELHASGSGFRVARPTPFDAVRARRIALRYVARGGFLEAYAAAEEFHDNPDASIWVEPLRQAADLINGNPVDREAISLKPLRTIARDADRIPSLLVAMRSENALLMQRWYDAINTSMTFLDAAIKDAIVQCPQVKEASPWNRRIIFHHDPPSELRQAGLKDQDANNPLQFKIHTAGHEALRAWCAFLEEFQPGLGLSTLLSIVRDWPGEGEFSLADYRNFNTHGVLKREELTAALQDFTGRGLWSAKLLQPEERVSIQPGKTFLAMPAVEEILKNLLGVQFPPFVLYQCLIQELCKVLINPHGRA